MIVKALDPDTASRKRSIWYGIDRKDLERKAQELHQKHHVAGRCCYPVRPRAEDDSRYPLPLELEKSLADDFAFIAACQPQVEVVSAVVIEQGVDESSLHIRLAANNGVTLEVKETFDRLFETLRMLAKRETVRNESQKQILQLIIELNRNRILGRLASKKFCPPAHMNKTRNPLPDQLRQLCESISRSNQGHKTGQKATLSNDISTFGAIFDRLEECRPAETISLLHEAVQSAFTLTVDGTNFPNRLKTCGLPDDPLDRRAVREVCKIANYWRIARQLAICSQKYCNHFAKIEWCEQTPYAASTTSTIIPKQFVHAEIQLITHYKLNPKALMPRAIGTSKEACFLCDSFIRADGRFAITGAHRQMYPQWTVPDLHTYSTDTVRCFRKTMLQVHQDVVKEYMIAKRPSRHRPLPPQSAINLNIIQLITPSLSTHTLMNRTIIDASTRRSCSNVTRNRSQLTSNTSSGIHSNVRREESVGIPTGTHQQPLEMILNVNHDDNSTRDTDWVEIFATFETTHARELVKPFSSRGYPSAVTLKAVEADTKYPAIHLEHLPVGDDFVLDTIIDDSSRQLCFVLVGTRGQRIQLCCQWRF